MTTLITRLTRPAVGVNHLSHTRHRNVGFTLAVVGLALAVVTLIANLVAADQLTTSPIDASTTLAWSFGLTTTAIGTIKVAIAVVLVGILVRLWLRVDSIRAALPDLKAAGGTAGGTGDVKTAYGVATRTASVPAPLPIHRMARTMWFPMVVMGAMAVTIGLVISLVWAGSVGTSTELPAAAWAQGLQFLGEGMLLAGIAFLLGSILAGLREGGGVVQEELGLTVQTLKMPRTAKVFVGLMMLGLMLAIAQFVLYLVAIGASNPAAWFAWLGPFRELALGLILAGIVMALVTIGNVLGFQFDRIRSIIVEGR